MHTSLDGKARCFGSKKGQELYAHYHDTEWGVASYDDQYLFEMLILEGAQAGLNWETILKRREGYRRIFHEFDVLKVASMQDGELEAALLDEGIIRNRLKVFSARKNARIYIDIQKEFGSFSAYVWQFVNNEQKIGYWKKLSDVPVTTSESDALSKDLKKRGMSFVGSTIMYAYMQATGLVNDHVLGCVCAPPKS